MPCGATLRLANTRSYSKATRNHNAPRDDSSRVLHRAKVIAIDWILIRHQPASPGSSRARARAREPGGWCSGYASYAVAEHGAKTLRLFIGVQERRRRRSTSPLPPSLASLYPPAAGLKTEPRFAVVRLRRIRARRVLDSLRRGDYRGRGTRLPRGLKPAVTETHGPRIQLPSCGIRSGTRSRNDPRVFETAAHAVSGR